MLAIKNTIPSRLLTSPVDIEALTVELVFSRPIILCVIYIPPQSSNEYVNTCFNHIQSLVNDLHPVFILGDFNLPDINWHTLTGSTTNSKRFCELVFDNNLSQMINQPTHICGNILDLVLTNGDNMISSLKVHPQFSEQLSTDHYMISFNINIRRRNPNKPKARYVFNFSKVNVDSLQSSLLSSNLQTCFNFSNTEVIWEIINKSIVESMYQSIPRVRVTNNQFPVWFTKEIRHQIKCIRTLCKRYRDHPTDHTKDRLQHATNCLNSLIKQAKTSYEESIIQNLSSNRNF